MSYNKCTRSLIDISLSSVQVVTIDLTSDPSLSLSHRYYLLPVSACTYTGDTETTDLPKMYLKPGQLTRIDRNALNVLDNADSNAMGKPIL